MNPSSRGILTQMLPAFRRSHVPERALSCGHDGRLELRRLEFDRRTMSRVQDHRLVTVQQRGEALSRYRHRLAGEAGSERLLVEDRAIREYRNERALVLLERKRR